MIMIDQLQISVGHKKKDKISEQEALLVQQALEEIACDKVLSKTMVGFIRLLAFAKLPANLAKKLEIVVDQ